MGFDKSKWPTEKKVAEYKKYLESSLQSIKDGWYPYGTQQEAWEAALDVFLAYFYKDERRALLDVQPQDNSTEPQEG